jgi:hypothetical protein
MAAQSILASEAEQVTVDGPSGEQVQLTRPLHCSLLKTLAAFSIEMSLSGDWCLMSTASLTGYLKQLSTACDITASQDPESMCLTTAPDQANPHHVSN